MDEAARDTRGFGWAFVPAFLFLAALAMVVPVDHDEGQYIAATWLTARGFLPVLDYPYLQTPLQPYLMAPLAWIAPGWLLVASRLANAALVAGAAVLTARLVARLSGRRDAGWFAALLLVASDSVQFGGVVARNDALPLFLFALGLERLWGRATPSLRRLLIAGIALGAAASAKASFALPAGMAGLLALLSLRREAPRAVGAFLGGLLIGALPTLLTLAAAPSRAWFYFVTYSTDGVRAFQALNHSLDLLEWPARLRELFRFAVRGSLLATGIYGLWLLVRGRGSTKAWPLGIGPGPILLAALVASVLPMPAYRQYLIPLAVPLIAWIAARGGFGRWASLRAPIGLALGAAFLVLSTNKRMQVALKAQPFERPIASTRLAHQAGAIAAARGARTIGGLDAVRATDSGLALDPRFATGPFLFRAGNLPSCRVDGRCPLTFATLSGPTPDALLVGTEPEVVPGLGTSLDAPIETWAQVNRMTKREVGPLAVWTRR